MTRWCRRLLLLCLASLFTVAGLGVSAEYREVTARKPIVAALIDPARDLTEYRLSKLEQEFQRQTAAASSERRWILGLLLGNLVAIIVHLGHSLTSRWPAPARGDDR